MDILFEGFDCENSSNLDFILEDFLQEFPGDIHLHLCDDEIYVEDEEICVEVEDVVKENEPELSEHEKLRRGKVLRYLEKKKRRKFSKKGAIYTSRQRVANSRPRINGRFLPASIGDFIPVNELRRRNRSLINNNNN